MPPAARADEPRETETRARPVAVRASRVGSAQRVKYDRPNSIPSRLSASSMYCLELCDRLASRRQDRRSLHGTFTPTPPPNSVRFSETVVVVVGVTRTVARL